MQHRRRELLSRPARLALLSIAATAAGLAALIGASASADDGGPRPPAGQWPSASCNRWHPCPTTTTTQPPATTQPPVETTPPPQTTPPPPSATAPETTTSPPQETATTTRTRTTTQPPVWTEPQLPVTGARPAVVGVSVGLAIVLIAGGVGLLWWRRRRDREHADGVA